MTLTSCKLSFQIYKEFMDTKFISNKVIRIDEKISILKLVF
jgi:hypothetical protein